MLMAHAYKKQQEMAALEADDSDACVWIERKAAHGPSIGCGAHKITDFTRHLNAGWADSGALKARLQGTGGISWK